MTTATSWYFYLYFFENFWTFFCWIIEYKRKKKPKQLWFKYREDSLYLCFVILFGYSVKIMINFFLVSIYSKPLYSTSAAYFFWWIYVVCFFYVFSMYYIYFLINVDKKWNSWDSTLTWLCYHLACFLFWVDCVIFVKENLWLND